MKFNLEKQIQNLVPFLLLGIVIALGIGLSIIFSYMILWGLLIGGIIGVVDWLRRYFFVTKPIKKTETNGRILEHDEQDR